MQSLTFAQLDPLHRMAGRIARGVRRRLRLPEHEEEDLRQDLLADLLARLPAYRASRGTLEAFALLCFRHRASLLAFRASRERRGRHPTSLDDLLPGGATVGTTLSEADGYAAWMGHSTDPFSAVERRVDLERAAGLLTEEDVRLCVALVGCARGAAHRAGVSRATAFRRVREMRLRLSAGGMAPAA